MRPAHLLTMLASFILPTSSLLAQSAQPGTTPDNGIIVKGQKPEKKVCKTFDPPTGSRVGERRLCLTPSEWRLSEDAALRNMDKMNLHTQADQAQTLNEKGLANRGYPH